ncbi:hypothetical protein Cni_G06386 [Canna indica]|uniref:hAT-like transposase RNase-H fold domain-containing protein n=1 Tax=Canna indica TaxID=4628 RepID=A0AAQ3JYF1_9LILI|nr:hypothetical protein Cni_G06386 [Canna indica]
MDNSANKAADTESTTCAQSSTKVDSKKSRSEIWDHFLKKKDEKIVVSMFSTLIECERGSNPRLRSMARKMRDKFDKYYGSVERTNMMVLIAVVLDPRYKLRFLKYCCRRICCDADRVEEMAQNVTRVLERLFAFYEKSHSSSE